MEQRLTLKQSGLAMLLAFFCSYSLSAYFELSNSANLVFVGLCGLFAFAALLPGEKKELRLSLFMGFLFSLGRVIGYSYDRLDSYGLIFKNRAVFGKAALAVLGLTVVSSAAFLCLIRLPTHRHTAYKNRIGRRAFLLAVTLIIAAGSIPYLVIYWPGLNIFDTHDQILQFFGFPSYIGDGSALSDHHPLLTTLIFGWFMKIGLWLGKANIGQALYSIISTLAVAYCWALNLDTLREYGMDERISMVIALFLSIWPVTALYAFNMGKDSAVIPILLLYSNRMTEQVSTSGEVFTNRKYRIRLFADLMLLMMLRKSSLYAVILAGILLIFFYRKQFLRILSVYLSAVLFFAVGYTHLLLPALGIIPGESREMFSIPFQQTARYLNTYPEDIREDEREIISHVLSLEAVDNYDPRLSDPVKDTSRNADRQEYAAYFKVWLSMGLRHPGVYIDAWLNMIYGYYYPSESNTIVCLTLNSPDQGDLVLRQNPQMEDTRLSVFNWIYYPLRRLPGLGCLFYVDTLTWSFLFALALLIFRRGLCAAVPFGYFFGIWGISLLSPKSGEIRYILPLLYALPTMLTVAVLPQKGKQTQNLSAV